MVVSSVRWSFLLRYTSPHCEMVPRSMDYYPLRYTSPHCEMVVSIEIYDPHCEMVVSGDRYPLCVVSVSTMTCNYPLTYCNHVISLWSRALIDEHSGMVLGKLVSDIWNDDPRDSDIFVRILNYLRYGM